MYYGLGGEPLSDLPLSRFRPGAWCPHRGRLLNHNIVLLGNLYFIGLPRAVYLVLIKSVHVNVDTAGCCRRISFLLRVKALKDPA